MAERLAPKEKEKDKEKVARPKTGAASSSMGKLLEEGKSLQTEAPKGEVTKRKPRSKFWDMLHVSGIFACFVFLGVRDIWDQGVK